MYDYNRIGKDGKKRKFHIDEALKVLKFNIFDGKTRQNLFLQFNKSFTVEELCNCKYFKVSKYDIKTSLELETKNDEFNVILCLSGNGKIESNSECVEFEKGNCIFITNGDEKVKISGETEILKINC